MILSYSDLAKRWNVSVNVLMVRKHRGMLPEPDIQIGRSPGWHEDTIKDWENERDKAD